MSLISEDYVVSVRTVKAYRGVPAALILILEYRWRWIVSFTSRPLYP